MEPICFVFSEKIVTLVLQEECLQIVNGFLRFFHGGEGELTLDSSLLTIRMADKRKPKPASDGIHRNKIEVHFLVTSLTTLLTYDKD